MPQSHRGQFGPGSLLALLALAAGSAVADPLPPLRVNPALLGAGTPPAPAIAEPVAAVKPVAPAPQVVEPPPTARIDLSTDQPRNMAAPAPVPAQQARSTPPAKPATPPAASTKASPALPVQPPAPAPAPAPASLPPAAVAEAPRRPPEPQPKPEPLPPVVPRAATAESIQKPQEPPEVAEPRNIPPLYSAHVAAGELPDPRLKPSAAVLPWIKRPGEKLPTFIAADQVTSKVDVELVAEGNVEMRMRNTSLQSDRLTYLPATDEIEAEGNVRLAADGDRIQGPRMRMKMDENTGFFEQPEYSIRRVKTGSDPTLSTGNEAPPQVKPAPGHVKSGSLWTGDEEAPARDLTTGYGKAERMAFEGEGQFHLTNSTYSTCAPVAGRDPDWFMRTTDLRLDYDAEEGTARNATLVFQGVPILYSPWMNFSLNNERKSGLLTPTGGTTSRGGTEFTLPFYWNIAPNMDATFAPRIMAKRGTLWNAEYRYLEPTYRGTLQGQYLGHDKLTGTERTSYSLAHTQNLGYGFSGTLNLNGVSDNTFFSDLGHGPAVTSTTNLVRQGTLSYGGGWWSANLLVQSFQTLQDPDQPPVTKPYQRLPQLTVNAYRGDLPLGMALAFAGEYVDFRIPTQGMPEAKRFTMYPQLALPMQTDILSVTPKIGLSTTHYDFTNPPAGTPDKLTRTLPIFSVDSGMTYERDFDWQGKALTQTLEPRLYYLYVPNRSQNKIPVFDTGTTDFNFAQIFAENRYSGADRIGDANQITTMISSRLLDPQTGAEAVRAAIGQRFYFTGQKVTLPGEAKRNDHTSDLLGFFSGRVLPDASLDVAMEYNPQSRWFERFNVGGRYQPEAGKVLNAGYRFTRDQFSTPGVSQFDISGQWPVFGGWHGVGRVNYSIKDQRMIETVAGLEYDGGCWVGRVVFHRIATQQNTSNTSFFLQLEFNGFAQVGTNPLDMLKRNVSGYSVIGQQNPESPFITP
jgi:LPS-assembly protein